MGLFFVYILKASVCLTLFYLFYKLLLSRETFHRFNRIVLLSLLLLSLLLPLVQLTTTEQTEVHRTVLTLEQLLMMAGQTSGVAVTQAEEATVSWIQVALLFYLAGIAFFACRHLYTLTRLAMLLRSGRREKMERGVWLIVHTKDIAPFSWMKYIVIAEKDLKENGREILIHEMAHIRNRHSVDLLVGDICIFFQWFNPAAWLLKQELQNIHEYEADETVIKEGVDAKQYQLLLIKKAVGTRLYSMANSFNHSKLKKRITMMLREKSSPWARLKYLYVLPLAAIAVTAFARPEISNKMEEISAVKVNDLAAIVETKVQKTVERQKETTDSPVDYSSRITSSKNPKTGDLNHRISVDLKILDEKGKPVEKGSVIVIPFSTNTGAISGPGGEVKLTGIPAGNVLRIFYGGAANSGIFVTAMPKLTLTLHSNKKPRKVVEKQAEIVRDTVVSKAQKTVPKVVNDTNKAVRMEDVKVVGYKTTTNSLETVPGKAWDGNWVGGVNFHRLSSSKSTGNPLFIVNGKEIDYSLLNAIRPDRIESISVLKDVTATEVYGDKGKNGVILVTLLTEEEFQENQKRQNSDIQASDRVKIASMKIVAEKDGIDSKNVTYFVGGEKVAPEAVKQLEDNNAFTISRVSASKSRDGNNGFIHIVTKKRNTMKVGDNELKVVGKVQDEGRDPIGGASVLIKGTNQGTIADADGYFRIVTPKDAILTISYFGVETAEVKVSSSPLVVTLKK